VGSAEEATARTGPTGEAQEAEIVGGRVESHKGSHEEALGGLSQSQESCGMGEAPGDFAARWPRVGLG